jgi:hypothetical protein
MTNHNKLFLIISSSCTCNKCGIIKKNWLIYDPRANGCGWIVYFIRLAQAKDVPFERIIRDSLQIGHISIPMRSVYVEGNVLQL